jgi:uncharacterized alkaline shock family protein YloU
MTIGKEIISEIKNIDDENPNGYVYVSSDFSEDKVKNVINELNSMTKITLKNIETFSFTVEMKSDNNYQYNVELIQGLDDDIFFRIDRSIKTF